MTGLSNAKKSASFFTNTLGLSHHGDHAQEECRRFNNILPDA